MLNAKNERELAYLVEVDDIIPMNADRLECARVMGWNCVVGKGEFHKGDIAVYFEIDSKVPEVEPFASMEFLASKHFKIKSQKIRGVISQGLLMPVSAFNFKEVHNVNDESKFLTKELDVTYAVAEDNKRKSNGDPNAKYKSMASRHAKLFRKKPFRWLMRRAWGRKFLFLFFGRKGDRKSDWPAWVVKTDEERCQNLVWSQYAGTGPWIRTEKIDGTSTTFTMRRKGNKYEFIVCSRNVAFTKPDKKCFYDTNVYTEMAEKYDIENVLKELFRVNMFKNANWITIQGETYGQGVQVRDYSLKGHDLAVFNLISDVTGRINSKDGKEMLEKRGVPWVPIYDDVEAMPETVDELLVESDGNSAIDGLPREGFVYRSIDGKQSFKAVSNSFLLKYHQ